jgi:CubicO group peptidase (beta-lactamase class C family)
MKGVGTLISHRDGVGWQAVRMDHTVTPIDGFVAPGFEAARDAFAANFAERGEVGAGVCVIIAGRVVVDLVGGWADETRTRPWLPDTLVDVYSTGKGLLTMLALELVGEGRLSLDAPIADVWPEFAAEGKQAVTLRQALTHRAGVPAIRQALTDDDLWHWDRMTAALASTAPWWEPGTRHTYHTNTFGHLVGEVIRRVSGEMPGTRLRRLADQVGADVWFGVPARHLHRCADVIWAPGRAMPAFDPYQLEGEAQMLALGYANPPGYSSMGVVNSVEWRTAQVPSTNGHATAAGVARMYGGVLDRGWIPADLLSEAARVQSSGPCTVLGEDVEFGLGFTPTGSRRPLGTNPHSFGHFGTGGSLGFADPDAHLSFGYVMNHVIPRWQSTRNRALIDAVYSSL